MVEIKDLNKLYEIDGGIDISGNLINAFATWFVNAALIVVHSLYIIKEYITNKNKNTQGTVSEGAENSKE